MEIVPGTLLGPYQIVAPIGAGGMGTVYFEALPVLRQLIDGIEAAHEKGITHRDLDGRIAFISGLVSWTFAPGAR